jgi:acetyltransferase
VLIDEGGRLAELSASTMAALDEVLPATWSCANPLDMIGDATAERYASALDLVMKDPNVDGVLVISCPTAVLSPIGAAKAVVRVVDGRRHPTLLTSWLGDGAAKEAHHHFAEHGIPSYDTPDDAVQAFMHMAQYRANQEMLRETPPSLAEALTPDTETAQALIAEVLAQGRNWMTEPESKALLAAYDIPVAKTMIASTPEEAAALAADLGGAVALKIVAPAITHKSDVGGVALDLLGPKQVLDCAKVMLERVRQARPDAAITGFSVQAMIHRPGAHELILGMIDDRQFGPVLLFGQGGVAVEEIDDKAMSLPPLNMRLAREMMARTRIHRQLKGYRDRPPADLDAIALTLIKLSQLVIDVAEIEEMEINPLLADEHGVVALDARVKLSRAVRSGTERLAIRPYPKELEETVRLKDGRDLLLRPVLPEDEPALAAMVRALTPEEARLRFFAPVKALTHIMAARFTQLDYDREMALILVAPGIPGRSEIFAVVRISTDPDDERAEYAIIVRHDLTDQGLGRMLMERIIAYARKRGVKEIVGDVLRENRPMLELCSSLGFRHSVVEDEPTTMRVSLAL